MGLAAAPFWVAAPRGAAALPSPALFLLWAGGFWRSPVLRARRAFVFRAGHVLPLVPILGEHF